MPRNTSNVLGDHFDNLISRQVQNGRYASAGEVVRRALRLLEEHEHRVQALRQALVDGENSGHSTPLDMKESRRKARLEAGLDV